MYLQTPLLAVETVSISPVALMALRQEEALPHLVHHTLAVFPTFHPLLLAAVLVVARQIPLKPVSVPSLAALVSRRLNRRHQHHSLG